MRETGIYQSLGNLKYFIPHPLPPSNPSLEFNAEIMTLYGEAIFILGQLKGLNWVRIPEEEHFIEAYVLKEALLSSAIEGIYTTLSEVYTQSFENAKPSKATQLVMNYKYALMAARLMMLEEKLPLVTRVILKAHEILMSKGEGESASPGQFRKQSVRVGDLVPPPAPEVPNLMSGLERYINEDFELPPLFKAGLMHVHFETIHPFLDGNGRIGRLLIILMLMDNGLLDSPILYLSYYFKKYQTEYYQKLDRVRTHGDFEGWIIFYLKAIRDSSKDAHERAKDIENLERELKELITTNISFKKMRRTAIVVLEFLFTQPITNIAEMSQKVGKAYNTVQNIFKEFVKHSIIVEKIVHKRNKLYHFKPYLTLLEKEY